MNKLFLPLEAKWYEMIERGEKTEEYREIKPYWIRRLCYCWNDLKFIYCVEEGQEACQRCFDGAGNDAYMCYPYDAVTFAYGYTKRQMTFRVESICYGMGKTEWGAPKDKEVFIIKLGERIK